MSKLILGFDSWTKGSHHYSRLVSSLKKFDYRLLLLHIGSWGHDINRPQEENINGLQVRDISFYGNKDFLEILLQERPSAILLLSTRAFAHMTMMRYARQLNIPSVYLAHGLAGIEPSMHKGNKIYKVKLKAQVATFFKRIEKNLFHLIPIYIKALIRTEASFKIWLQCFKEIYSKTLARLSLFYLADACPSIYCVWTKAECKEILSVNRATKGSIFVVGNPDFLTQSLSKLDIGCCLKKNNKSKKIIYIEAGFLSTGMIYDNFSELLKHINGIKNAVKKSGFSLAIKPKPHGALYNQKYLKQLKSCGIQIIENADFLKSLKKSAGAICEPSSASMLAAALGLPIFLVGFGPFSNQQYGYVLTSYPRTFYIKDINMVDFCKFRRANKKQKNAFKIWIENNIGPLPSNDFGQRVSTAINKIILTKTQNKLLKK